MANTSISLTQLDFDGLKENLKGFLRSQSIFKDYDFDGSNLNVLIELLAYNSYLNTFYLNMVASESFLDSAQIKDSAVSHAKALNYTPRSFISSEATIRLSLKALDDQSSIVLPKGTIFSGKNGSDSFTFTTDKNIIIPRQNGNFESEAFSIFEGNLVTETFVFDSTVEGFTVKISNKNIDTRSLSVTIIEDDGANVIEYLRATSLFGLTEETPVYFVQATSNDSYELVFGDGLFGRKPKNFATIAVTYRNSSGELPNGISSFKLESTPDGSSNPIVTVISQASGGLVSESIESIKFNAPRAYTTQERAVTAEDFENLLKINFPEINVVSAYGGEQANPPQYGKVIISIDIKGFDGVPTSRQEVYSRFIRERAPLSIEPVFVQPDFIYLALDTKVKYNINITGLSTSDIESLVVSSILNYKDTELDDFKATARYSRIINQIDTSHPSILSNETEIRAIKYLSPILGSSRQYQIAFDVPLLTGPLAISQNIGPTLKNNCIESTPFIFENKLSYLTDDGQGIIWAVSLNDNQDFVKTKSVGTIDYETGVLQLNNIAISRIPNSDIIKIYAKTKFKDISATKNSILTINEEDITVQIEQVSE